jgi:uncharacterized membrane protein YkvI
MEKLSSIWRVYLLPAGVLQSLMIGGGYGTGREIVEYFTRFGLVGGLLGLTLVTTCFSILLATSYEFARLFQVYDYRRFFRALLGRGWIAFEVVYLAMCALVLAVIAAASERLVEECLHVPGRTGVAALLVLVVVFAFYGRDWVTRILAYKAVVLCWVFLIYFILTILHSGRLISAHFQHPQINVGWATSAIRYALYASVVIPTMLFATTSIGTRGQAVGSGIVSGLAAVLPAVLLHLSFGASYPGVLAQEIPTYWTITSLKFPSLTAAYIIVLFGGLFDVGIGFVQSINERVDGWSMEARGTKVTRLTRAAIALVCVLVSGGLSLFGIVPLIARGYGTMAYGFLLLFALPLLTVGLYRVSRGAAQTIRKESI